MKDRKKISSKMKNVVESKRNNTKRNDKTIIKPSPKIEGKTLRKK